MSGYDEEHNIQRPADDQQQHSYRRPDLSTFFSALDLVDTTGSADRAHHNAHADPLPANVSAVYRQLANAYQIILGETEGVFTPEGHGPAERTSNPLLESLITQLMQNANDPPTRPEGMPESFFDELERIPKKRLRPSDTCPICSNAFLEDKFPLVVQLPCHRDHIFDMECIRPWLKLNTTCPLDRKDLAKKKNVPVVAPAANDDEADYDDMYA